MRIRKLFLCLALKFLASGSGLLCQEVGAQSTSASRRVGSHIAFRLQGKVMSRLAIESLSGKPWDLQSHRPATGEAELAFFQPLGRRWGVDLGVGYGRYPHSFEFAVGLYHPDLRPGVIDLRASDYFLEATHFSIGGRYSYPIGKQLWLQAGGGLKLSNYGESFISTSASVEGLSGPSQRIFLLQIDYMKRLLVPSIYGKAGAVWDTKRRLSFLSAMLVYTYCFETIGSGQFHFYNIGYKSYGNVRQEINSLGLEVGAGLRIGRSR